MTHEALFHTIGEANALQRLVQRLAALPPISWLLSFILPPLDRLALRASGGRWALVTLLAGVPTVVLSTRGARSGAERRVTLLGIPDGPRVVLIASYWGSRHHPAWYHNLRADPRAALSIAGRTAAYLAREVEGDEREQLWAKAVAVYPGFDAYRRRARREIPVMVLEPARGSQDRGHLPPAWC